MPLLSLALGWWFAADVSALADPHFPTRLDAHRRLSAAGWVAYPALRAGLTSDAPERADRCADIIARLPTVVDLVERLTDAALAGMLAGADPVPALTPAMWLTLEGAVCRAAARVGPVPVRSWCGDKAAVVSGDYRGWCRRPAFYAGDHAGDVRVLAEGVRRATCGSR